MSRDLPLSLTLAALSRSIETFSSFVFVLFFQIIFSFSLLFFFIFAAPVRRALEKFRQRPVVLCGVKEESMMLKGICAAVVAK